MTDAIDPATIVTMDRSGRLVLPKAIRDEAGIRPGAPLRIRVRDGHIEIEPQYEPIQSVERHGMQVMERTEPGEALTADQVRRTTRALREGRSK
ncbi:MAG: AbrB/MazE/SpoVT family DNA-binding domain-containing protein [Planctomycetes bacterium]|nr:AbrB/MazE/SpoVT family DNA-binding domain-containing protein [Planctomycetota bacterium]